MVIQQSGNAYNFSFPLVLGSAMCELGNGTHISLWFDKWVGSKRLMISFPTLFSFAKAKFCTMASQFQGGHWEIQPHPNLSASASRELEALMELLNGIEPHDTEVGLWALAKSSQGLHDLFLSAAACNLFGQLRHIFAAPCSRGFFMDGPERARVFETAARMLSELADLVKLWSSREEDRHAMMSWVDSLR
ncbi:hypothetical protein VPH35_010179 [Triticum aestivum]